MEDKVKAIKPEADQLSDALGLPKERAKFLEDNVSAMVKDIFDKANNDPEDKGPTIAQMLERVCEPCQTSAEVSYISYQFRIYIMQLRQQQHDPIMGIMIDLSRGR